MRIERLLLERFGHFEGFDLDFGPVPRLHVVFGPNEAGKSTVLAAIGDLLFGMPAQTPYNFRHPYGTLRIGARVVSAAGVTLEFKRRKAKTHSGTLLTLGDAESPLPDDALAPFLGGADRSLFERMFGLDHRRLRDAGERMIQSDGDLGQAIFEAGSGIDSLNRVLGNLAAELDALGVPGQRASKKPLWRSVEEFTAAQRDGRGGTLKVDEVRAVERKVTAAEQERQRIASELADVRRRKARVERVRRTGPVIADLERLGRELDAMGPVPELPPTFEAEWAELAKGAAAAAHALEVAGSHLEEARSNLAAHPETVAYGPHETVIGEVREGLGRHRKDVADEQRLTRDVAAAEEDVAARLRALGHDPERAFRDGDPRELMPTAAEMARARGVVQAAVAAAARREELGRILSGAERDLAAARLELADCGTVVDPGPAAALADEALGLGDVEAGALAARLAAEGASRAAEEAVARLPGWGRSGDALASCPFPDPVALASLVARLADVAAEREALGAAIDRGDRALVDARSRLARLHADGEVPTAKAIMAMRERREGFWRVIRDTLLYGTSRSDERQDFAAARAAEFEATVRKADDLVDRREAQAQRVAAVAELRATEVASEGRLRLDRQALARSEVEERRASGDWAALWAGSGFAPGAPAGAAAWLAAKDEALRSLAAAREATGRFDRAAALAVRARSLATRAAVLLGETLDGSTHEDANARIVRLRAVLAERRALWARARSAATDVARCASRREEAVRALADLSRDDAARLEGWEALAPRLGWRPTATVAEADTVLRGWEGLAAPLSERETASRRLVGLREDERSFGRRVAEVEEILVSISGPATDGSAGTPETILRHLEDGLASERAALARHREARRATAVAARELEGARATLAAAESAVAGFRRLHGLAPDADCVSVGQGAAAARHLRATIARRRMDLMDSGEGLGEPALREDAASMPAESVAVEVAALGEREEELVEAGQRAAQDWWSADAALAQVTSRVGGVDAQGRERAATLAFGGHAERWLLLAAAQGIMSRAVERYRAVNQHPMVARAGELMSELTRGHPNPIERLSAEYRDKKKITLLGIRRDGSPCEIANMTEGTRDQLFLGLRIAAIERYVQAREPLPFVADDLFITSDDERTECGLQALAALARTTQVILFTHHRSVLRSAEGLAESHGVMTHLLPERHASGPVPSHGADGAARAGPRRLAAPRSASPSALR